MQKNLQHNTDTCGMSNQYQPQVAVHTPAQTQMLPQQPPSYEQATHVQHTITPATQVIVIQRKCATANRQTLVTSCNLFTDQPPPAVGPDPCFITCPHCHVQKLTRVEYAPSVRTHCMAALLCIVG